MEAKALKARRVMMGLRWRSGSSLRKFLAWWTGLSRVVVRRTDLTWVGLVWFGRSVISFCVLFNMLGCAGTSVLSKKGTIDQKKESAYLELKSYLSKGPVHDFVLVPEGEFVFFFNPEIKPWLQKKWSYADLQMIRNRLAPILNIELTERGFVKAATRDLGEATKKDETNYDAIWVRDAAWVFWGFQETGKKDEARKLVLALWDYYASAPQLARLNQVIQKPELVQDKMAVPHIRFDGASPTLDDVYVDGKSEVWNHRQMDAHGLFVLSVLKSFQMGLISEKDLTPDRVKALALLPVFFRAVGFWQLEEAGAWEEIDRRNTSSIAIVTRSMMQMRDLLKRKPGLQKELNRGASAYRVNLVSLADELVVQGLKVVKQQIQWGGESPDYDRIQQPNLFRRADAALFNVLLPEPLPGLTEQELRGALASLESLKRPAGILRYENDSYQSGNFWIQEPGKGVKEGTVGTTGDTSDDQAFQTRLEALIPHTEAQWFFDSKLAMARMELHRMAVQRRDQRQAQQDFVYAQLHLKRALGQITGSRDGRPLRAADGVPVKDWLAPESVNVIVLDHRVFYLPSPITPLNWAKASLDMALIRMERLMKPTP